MRPSRSVLSTAYLSLIVVLPIAALLWASRAQGLHQFWAVVTAPEALAALKLSLGAAVIVSLVNAVLGTITAWVLVRDDFRGKSIVNAVIDLPFALPTIVAGLVLLALYGPHSPVGINIAFTRTAIFLALLFVTLPFVVRTVQPVLLELDAEMEQAARSLGASEFTGLPQHRAAEHPPGDPLRRRARVRARGRRDRRARPDLRQPPVQDRGRVGVRLQPHPERRSDRRCGGRGRAARDLLRDAPRDRRPALPRHEVRACLGATACATVALAYLVVVLLGPLAMVFWRTFDQGAGHFWHSLSDPNTVHAFKITLIITAIAVPLNTLFGIVCALAIVRQRFPGEGIVNALVDLPLALSPVVVGMALFLLYGRTGWFGSWFARHGIQILFALPSMVIATIFVSLPFVAREVVPTLREIGDEQEQAAHTLGRRIVGDVLADHPPSIRWAVIYGVVADDRPVPRRVRRRRGRVRPHRGPDRDRDPARAGPLRELRRGGGVRDLARARRDVRDRADRDDSLATEGGPADVDRSPQRLQALR